MTPEEHLRLLAVKEIARELRLDAIENESFSKDETFTDNEPRWAVYRVGADHYTYLILYPQGHGLAIEQGAGDTVGNTPTDIINAIRKQGNAIRWRASAGTIELALFNITQKSLSHKLIEGPMNCEMVKP